MALLLTSVLLASACGSRTAGDRPNVVVILADDLNDWVRALTSHPNARTPYIDRLASQGVLFRQAYALFCEVRSIQNRLASRSVTAHQRHLRQRSLMASPVAGCRGSFRGFPERRLHGGRRGQGIPLHRRIQSARRLGRIFLDDVRKRQNPALFGLSG